MMDEITKTIRAQLHERATSPLFGAFAISWIGWNHRCIIALASDLPLEKKFSFVDSVLYPSITDAWLRGVAYPLITALLLIFVYPYPSRWIFEFWRKQQKLQKEIQQRIDDETPLTREEAKKIRQDALQAMIRMEEQLRTRSDEIERLRTELEAIRTIRSPKDEESDLQGNQSRSDDLSAEQISMLRLIADRDDGIEMTSLLDKSGNNRVLAQFNLGELKNRGFATENYSRERHHFYKVTHEGRAVLVRTPIEPQKS